MIKIDPIYIAQVKSASSLADLFDLVQQAIKLEHATIPPYLTASLSIVPGSNTAIARIIHSIVVEEMLHMSIACNILIALGGKPVLNQPDFVPNYPSALPMGIGSDLVIGLLPLSMDVIKNAFMCIEEPEDPLDFPAKAFFSLLPEAAPEFATIGQFYKAIQEQIQELAPDTLPGDPKKQMVNNDFFSPDLLFAIVKKEDAIRAIDIIIEQGEGTSKTPIGTAGELAHFYKFEEIYRGKQLIADPTEPLGYSYSGGAIPFDATKVYPCKPNTKAAELPAGSEARMMADQFVQSYSGLLNALHRTFNEDPDYINTAMGMMYDIKLLGSKLVAMPFPGKAGFTVGPPFQSI